MAQIHRYTTKVFIANELEYYYVCSELRCLPISLKRNMKRYLNSPVYVETACSSQASGFWENSAYCEVHISVEKWKTTTTTLLVFMQGVVALWQFVNL